VDENLATLLTIPIVYRLCCTIRGGSRQASTDGQKWADIFYKLPTESDKTTKNPKYKIWLPR